MENAGSAVTRQEVLFLICNYLSQPGRSSIPWHGQNSKKENLKLMNRLATNNIPKLLCLALVLALPCAAQYGPAPTYVGIPSIIFTPAAQQQDEWCWAASIQMILSYYHIPVTQEMIVNQIKGGLI